MFGLTPYGRFSHRGEELQNDFEDVMNSFWAPFTAWTQQLPFASPYAMRSDVRETEKEYTVKADLPGLKKEEIHLDFTDGVLTVSAERKQENEVKGEGGYLRRERSTGAFRRSYGFEDADGEGITAQYADGVLTVTVPKAKEQKPKGRRIDIQ